MLRCVLLAVVDNTAFRSFYASAVYLLYVSAAQGKDIFFKARRFFGANVLVNYGVLYAVSLIMPDIPARLGFKNGLMSESMIILFAVLSICTAKNIRGVADEDGFTLIP